jgi:hypothetical protein
LFVWPLAEIRFRATSTATCRLARDADLWIDPMARLRDLPLAAQGT